MERVLTVFDSFADAEASERAYYRSLTPQQRLDLQLELIARHYGFDDENQPKFERVHRIVDLRRVEAGF